MKFAIIEILNPSTKLTLEVQKKMLLALKVMVNRFFPKVFILLITMKKILKGAYKEPLV